MAGMMQMIGLGRCEQNAIDGGRKHRADKAAPSGAEAIEDRGQRRLKVTHRFRSGIERAQGIDQHDLSVEP